MQQLILHIGRHKTGTSALQSTFVLNSTLLSDAGIYYPHTGRKKIAHHDIVNRINDASCDLDQDALLNRLLSEIRHCGKNTILISSEGFQNCDPRRVKSVFREFQIYVVVYLRDQLSYLESSYLQDVHEKNNHGSIEEYEQNFFSANYLTFISSWQKEFGKEQLIVRIFSNDLLVEGDVIKDFFLSVLNESLRIAVNYHSLELEDIATNPSLKGDALPFKLRLNKVQGSNYYFLGALYKALSAYSGQINKRLNLVSPELAESLDAKYKESNTKILEKLTLPVSALNFPTINEFATFKWMEPSRFHTFLKMLIEMEPECSRLIRDCYRVNIIKQGTDWQLICCNNIQMDSLNLVKVCRQQSSEWLTKIATENSAGYLIPDNRFNPETDRLIIEFNQDHTVDLLMESSA